MSIFISTLLGDFQAQGIQATLDGDGDIVFVHDGFSYVLCLDSDEDHFGCLILPNVWRLTDDPAGRQALRALNEINCRVKLVKGVIRERQVSLLVELWLQDPVYWSICLPRMLQTLVHALHLFVDAMQDVVAAR